MKKPYIIAETACSHDGSTERLKKIITNSVKAGFNAIQFQIWKHQNIIDLKHPDVNILKKVEINYKSWGKIINFTKKKKIDIIACIYDLEAFKFCYQKGIRLFKIHTSDLSNNYLLSEVSKKAKRIDLSVGASTSKEILEAISFVDQKKCKLWLMYGIQLFPTKPNAINLKYMGYLSKKFKLPVGYQDHSPYNLSGYTVPSTAIGLGVKIIEKHVTDFNSRHATDGESAIEIKNYKKFINICNESYQSLGELNKKSFSIEEKIYRKYSKKIIFSKTLIKKNQIIKAGDLIFLRTKSKGIMLHDLKKVLGKKAVNNIKKFETITFKKIQ